MLYDRELPTIYSKLKVDLPILNREIVWFKPYYTTIGQMVLYHTMIKPKEKRIARELLSTKIIKMSDGSQIKIGTTNLKSPKAVVLYLHTVCGNYTQMSHIAEIFHRENIAYVSYTRSGNDHELNFSKFNFVGRIDELQLVLDYIGVIYPNIPIMAIGASAGSALLIRYLGKYNKNKRISRAVLFSPGYDFIKSMHNMNVVTQSYLVSKMKWNVRRTNSHIHNLKNVNNLSDWVEFQAKILGYDSSDEYIKECDPSYHLDKINVPTMFISSYDDGVFEGNLTKKYLHLPFINDNLIIITTNRGGHVIFEDHGHDYPWCLRVARDWFKKHL